METEVSNIGGGFELNMVYWNSRLENEHMWLSSRLKPGELMWDMIAGIRAYAIRAAQKGCFTYANDLFPASNLMPEEQHNAQ